MVSPIASRKIIRTLIASVWLINGLICKLLNLVPRHELIVARIIGAEHAATFTPLMGISEILMSIWVLTGIKSRLCSITQIILVATMNILEFLLAPDLLLFGRMNAVFALILVLIIYINEFDLPKRHMATSSQ